MATKFKADYFLKDFATLREEMIARLPVISNGQITDLNESSVSVTLVEVVAAAADMLGFYLDSNALEAYLSTVRQPENVYRLTDLIGYRIREVTSAHASVRFSLATALTEEVYVPKGTRIGVAAGGGAGNVGLFLTTENTTIPIGDTESELVDAIQGYPYTESFTGDGTAGQFVKLAAADVDISSLRVFTGNIAWVQDDSFLYSEVEDFTYVVKTDYNGVTRVYFGDGKYGRTPSVGETITISYYQSSGSRGNVGAGSISLVFSDIRTVRTNSKVSGISVTNPAAAAGGGDRQSLEQVKTNAPGSLSALYRPLTKYDYNSLILRLGGVQHVNVWGEQEEDPPSYVNMNWANICLVPVGGGLPSENLRSIVRDYLLDHQPITVRLRFIDPEYIYVNVNLSIYVKPGYSQEDARIQITDSIREFFQLANVEFGQDIRQSTFYKMAMDTPGVDHVFVSNFETVVNDVTTDAGTEVILQKWEIPVLDTLTVNMHEASELPVPDLYPGEESIEESN
jgi:hypothetical protein